MASRQALRLFIAACAFILISVYALTASAQVQTLGEVSFAVPEGWEYEHPSGNDRATLSFSQDGNVWAMAVFKPLHSSGNPEADFRSAWAQDVRSMDAPEPIYDHNGTAGYSGRYGSTNTPDGAHYVYMCVLEAGQSAIPVLVVAPNRQAFNQLEPAILEFIEGVRIAPAKAQPAKKSITIADLVGEWHSGGESSVNYVDSHSGAYAGSSTVAHGAGYTIASDGSFTFRFAGLSNRQIIREQGSGTVELTPGFIAFHEKGTNHITRYHFISYQSAINGSTVLTLLGESYPAEAANISFYGERWIREAPKK